MVDHPEEDLEEDQVEDSNQEVVAIEVVEVDSAEEEAEVEIEEAEEVIVISLTFSYYRQRRFRGKRRTWRNWCKRWSKSRC